MQFEDIFIADKRAREMTAGARRRYNDAAREADTEEKRMLEEAARRAERDVTARRRAASREQERETGSDTAEAGIKKLAGLESSDIDRWVDEIYKRVVSDS